MKILHNLIAIIFLLNLASCAWFTNASTPLFPRLKVKVPPGSPAFQLGYSHGCSNVMYTRGNVLMRNTRKYQYDPKMIGNPEYRLGVSRGYTYCFQTVVSPAHAQSSFDRYLNPGNAATGYGVFDMSAGSVGDAWGGFFSAGSNWTAIDNSGVGLEGNVNLVGGGVFSNPLWSKNTSINFMGVW